MHLVNASLEGIHAGKRSRGVRESRVVLALEITGKKKRICVVAMSPFIFPFSERAREREGGRQRAASTVGKKRRSEGDASTKRSNFLSAHGPLTPGGRVDRSSAQTW